MGDVHSDRSEKEAHKVIQHIPFIGPLYSGVRAAVYAGKGNGDEAIRSGVAMDMGTLNTAIAFTPGILATARIVAGAAVTSANVGAGGIYK
ncbi:hypothetical protein FRB95_004886 [Tulasnella sp. JGI-2019a]|nr:hypothetical protein FRB95_004886 [Tulasnella sp. JGI-2019a]